MSKGYAKIQNKSVDGRESHDERSELFSHTLIHATAEPRLPSLLGRCPASLTASHASRDEIGRGLVKTWTDGSVLFRDRCTPIPHHDVVRPEPGERKESVVERSGRALG